MLNWLGGRPAPSQGEDDTNMPETPGPVFAARAIRSAFFGTPNPNEETILPSQEHPPPTTTSALEDNMASRLRPAESPTKPQGILMTPGTATTRRKTVSFGANVVDNKGKKGAGFGKSGLPTDFPGKFPSPWTPKVGQELAPPGKETALNKLLHQSRDKERPKTGIIGDSGADIVDARNTSASPPTAVTIVPRVADQYNDDGDRTFDLNKPHSQSGQYWKSEYERYHYEAKEEMRKLVKYKQLAKSYAKKKDGEALGLGERLREEQHKVAMMEQKLSQLATQVAENRMRGQDEDSPELLKDLARQTALTVQYKDEVERFQLALEEQDEDDIGAIGLRSTSPRTAQTLLEVSQELKKARDQLKEMKALKSELNSLKINASAAERRASRLNDEYTKVSQQLAKTQKDLAASEERRKTAEEHAAGMEKRYDDMKRLAKSKRDEAEMLLKKSHDEKVELRKELKSLKRQKSADSVASKPAAERPKESLARKEVDIVSRRHSTEIERKSGFQEPWEIYRKLRPLSHHDGVMQSSGSSKPEELRKVRISRAAAPPAQQAAANNKLSDNNRDSNSARATQSALSEIINNSNSPKPQAPATFDVTPGIVDRFSNLSISSPAFDIPSPEIPVKATVPQASSSRQPRSTQPRPSPGPSMFNIASSPPRPVASRSQSAGASRSRNTISNTRTTTGNETPRKQLPPDRAAAAKARLEQRNAEKKRAQDVADKINSKENVIR